MKTSRNRGVIPASIILLLAAAVGVTTSSAGSRPSMVAPDRLPERFSPPRHCCRPARGCDGNPSRRECQGDAVRACDDYDRIDGLGRRAAEQRHIG